MSALLLAAALADAPPKLAPATLLLRHATVWTQGPQGRLGDADVLVRGGKIVRIGRGLDAAGATLLDLGGKHVTPGLIDCHSHSAIRGDVNEGSNNVTAEVRVGDVLDPGDVDIYRQLAGGLTAAHLLHGSANTIGGQDAVIKLKWKAGAEELPLGGATPGIKFALGENPKRSNFRNPNLPERYPQTRMGVMESIRERFLAARDYLRRWDEYRQLPAREQERRAPPRRDLQLEAIAEILRGERVIHSHCYRQDEILALLRLCEEFGVKIRTFQHVLEGYKVADELAAHGVGGSTFSDWWAYKLEAYDAIPYNGALMHERGVLVTFNSDSGELARRLNLEAAKAVKYGGVDEVEALDFVTLNAARQLGAERRVGSLEPGKDADFVIWSGDPLSVYSIVEQTWVDGIREFDRASDLEARAAIERERQERIASVRGGDKAPAPPAPPAAAARPRPPDRALVYHDRWGSGGPAVSILHATVHTVSGATIEDGTVSFRGGRIIEVGAGLPALPGAEQVDARDQQLYPGLIDANTAVGLTEIGSVAGSVDLEETGEINADVNTAIAVNPDSEVIPVTRANGLTHVLSAPAGGLISGSSALIRLDGWTWEDLTAASPVALHVRWPSFRIQRFGFGQDPPSEEDQKKEREERLKRIRRAFDDARAYAKAKQAQGHGGRPLDADAGLDALGLALDGSVPVVVHAAELRQIENALSFAEEQGLRVVLAGSSDLGRVAERLHDARIPVIVTAVLALPEREDEPYDAAYALPAQLHAAGVTFCIASSGDSFSAPMARNLPYEAAMAAAFGLPREEALKAITLYPARILGLGDVLGSIEPGKSASLILTDGDPLEIRTHVLRSWIDGRPVDLKSNRHDRLYERYRRRPPP
ncbi:MAG TPA: amidohydrolase family protein [Candidatus Polarisedimenticolaceae bacterium]|nr:amidohydrolase family protein [Candidatus Polarisedimenticolaceae bacterium]